MLKKLISLSLCIMLLISTSACDNKPVINGIINTKPTETQPSGPTNISVNYWSLQDMETLSMKPLVVTEHTIKEDVVVKISKTPFDFNEDTIFASLKQNEFLKSNYKTFVNIIEEDSCGIYDQDLKHQQNIYVTNTLMSNTEKSSFSVSFTKYSAEYENVCYAELCFSNVQKNELLQENIATVVNDVFGEYAEYLLYAKDPDGKSYNPFQVFYNLDGKGLSEYITTENGHYYLIRDFQTGNVANTVNIVFRIGVAQNPNSNDYDYYRGNMPSIYNVMNLSFDNLLTDSFGNKNILDMEHFGDEIFQNLNKEYGYTALNDWSFYFYNADSGDVNKYLSLSCSAHLGKTYKYKEFSKLKYEIMLHEKDNKITAIMINVVGDVSHFKNKSKEDTFEQIKQLIEAIIPNIIFENLEYEQERVSYRTNISAIILGQSVSGNVIIEQTDDGYKFVIDLFPFTANNT